MRVDNSARSGGKIRIFLIFCNKKVCCVFSLESPHWGDSNEYTQYTINTPSVFEPLNSTVSSCDKQNTCFKVHIQAAKDLTSLILAFTVHIQQNSRSEGVFDDHFSYFSSKPYVVTHHLNRLIETVQMRGHNIWFYAELTKIIPNYHQILPLI